MSHSVRLGEKISRLIRAQNLRQTYDAGPFKMIAQCDSQLQRALFAHGKLNC